MAEKVSRVLSSLSAIEKILKFIDSDSLGDGESESVIRISLAQSCAKLHALQARNCLKRSFPGPSSILTTAFQEKVVSIFSNNKQVLELIITQALKVSNDLAKVDVNVSQVPWKDPITINELFLKCNNSAIIH